MTAVFLRNSSNKIFDMLILLTLFIFAFFLTFKAGERGFFALDQSIVFDGSYRILSGQIPYRDFVIPIGPMVFWLQAIFFKILGINYFSYIFGAAFINVLSTALSIIITRLLFPSKKFLSYIAGLVTAIWFYPPFGTPWAEQTAFFFSFLAITVLLFALLFKGNHSIINNLFIFSSGCFALLSVLSKQNAGLYILPLYFLLLIVAYLPNFRVIFYSAIIFSFGFIGSLLLFFLWLWLKSGLKNFLEYSLWIPSLLGVYRIFEEKNDFLRILFTGTCHYTHLHLLPIGIRLILLAAFLIAAFAFIFYIYNYKKIRDTSRRVPLSSILCIYAIIFQYLFIHTTMNQAENGIPFIGIIFTASLGLFFCCLKMKSLNQNIIKLILTIGISLPIFYLTKLGIEVSLTRKVQEFNNSKFQNYFTEEKLKALRWGQPTKISGVDIRKEDISNLLYHLKAKNNNFFIFPNFTIFYALLNVPSPGPLLWFHKGLTYHVIYNPALDTRIVNDLIKNVVGIVIIEENLLYSNLEDFPQLKSYISKNFIKTKQIGIFNIYEKRA